MTDLQSPESSFVPVASGRIGRPRWIRALEFWILLYRRTWRGSILTTFVFPTLYLAAMGLGLGGLITHHLGPHASVLSGVSYLSFVAPGVLGASAMQIGINEASYPVMSALRWQRSYLAMTATPLRVADVMYGHLAWIAIKLFVTCAVFVAITAAFGAVHSPLAVVEIPAATLIGLSFGVPMAALAARFRNDSAFSTINRLLIVPLFLFSGTFFPVSELPAALRVLAYCTPLYNGVALCRALAFGHFESLANLGHLVYLLAMAFLGISFANRSYQRRLYR